jgi:hypothetical protein
VAPSQSGSARSAVCCLTGVLLFIFCSHSC